MDAVSALLSAVGLRPWDLAFFGAWAAGSGLCVAFGLEKAYKALFGLALGCVLYVAATWFVASLASLPMSPESRGFFSANRILLLHAAWLGLWLSPVLAALSPSLSAAPHARGAVGLVARMVLVPGLVAAALSAIFVLSAQKSFPFDFDNFLARFPAVAASLKGGSSAYGWLQSYGVLAVVAAILAGTYAVLLSPWVARLAERLDAARLPSFFRDARPAAAPAHGPHGHDGNDGNDAHGHGSH